MAAISLFCSQYSDLMSSENGPWAESITAYVAFSNALFFTDTGCFLRQTIDLSHKNLFNRLDRPATLSVNLRR